MTNERCIEPLGQEILHLVRIFIHLADRGGEIVTGFALYFYRRGEGICEGGGQEKISQQRSFSVGASLAWHIFTIPPRCIAPVIHPSLGPIIVGIQVSSRLRVSRRMTPSGHGA